MSGREQAAEVDVILAPIEALLTPTYATVSDEAYGTNPRVEPVDPDDLRAAIAEARRISTPPADSP